MNREEAKNYLYGLWQNGQIPNNFTEDHSEYENAVKQLTKTGRLEFRDFFPPEYEVYSSDKL